MFGSVTAAAQFAADRVLRASRHWLRTLARVTQIPAAFAGGGMNVYTASLQSATSTPLWAASPAMARGTLRRFLARLRRGGVLLGERVWGNRRTARRLDAIAPTALVVELGATLATARDYKRKGVADVLDSGAIGFAEAVGVVGLGTLLPIALYGAVLLQRRARFFPKTAGPQLLPAGSRFVT